MNLGKVIELIKQYFSFNPLVEGQSLGGHDVFVGVEEEIPIHTERAGHMILSIHYDPDEIRTRFVSYKSTFFSLDEFLEFSKETEAAIRELMSLPVWSRIIEINQVMPEITKTLSALQKEIESLIENGTVRRTRRGEYYYLTIDEGDPFGDEFYFDYGFKISGPLSHVSKKLLQALVMNYRKEDQ